MELFLAQCSKPRWEADAQHHLFPRRAVIPRLPFWYQAGRSPKPTGAVPRKQDLISAVNHIGPTAVDTMRARCAIMKSADRAGENFESRPGLAFLPPTVLFSG